MKASEKQVDGTHYKDMGDFQPWDVLKHWLTPEEYRGYQKGVAIGYLARERSKGGDTDIRKAIHHLQRLEEEFDTPLPEIEEPLPTIEGLGGDGWIEWHGGRCPVPAETRVRIRTASGITNQCLAGSLRWQHHGIGNGGDIVAYRVLPD